MTKISLSAAVVDTFPEVRIGLLYIEGMRNEGRNVVIEQLLRAEELRQREILASVELPSLPEIKVWREAFKKFGSDPRDFRSSVEALLRRARAGNKPLPQINNLVDLYNYISIKYHVPVGAEDLAKIEGDVELAFASGSESGRALGADADESCYPGEVIYRDAKSFLCRRWNWREADRTKIDEQSTRAILVIDTVGGLGQETLAQALNETQALVERELSATVKSYILDSQNRSAALS
ncbi:MAG: hypothetical protein J0M12_11810 [Deltaproteobacteria bacterium]|nr:hypothetical protein [Deltaproteobacteria bacterium]